MRRKYSEYDGPPRRRADTASEQLTAFYKTGDESGTKKPDDGSAFNGLLPLKELENRSDEDD